MRRTHLPESFRVPSSLRQYEHLSAQHLLSERKGWEWEIWSLTRGIMETVDFSNISISGLLAYDSAFLYIPVIAVCTNVKSTAKRAVRTLSVSLDESACCLLKLLLEQQQCLTLWVPVSLISCCHFSSCSLVNHLSRSPLCNQLNLVIKWRKLKNAAQCRYRHFQRRHMSPTK